MSMKQASTREMVGYLKRIMRELGVKQLVLVDYDSPGLMLHTNRADFKPSRGNAVRTFPGPFMEVDDREPVTGWPECPTVTGSKWQAADDERAADRIARVSGDGRTTDDGA